MAGEFNDGQLHAEAEAEVRDVVLAGVLDCDDHSLNAAVAEAAGDENSVDILEKERGCVIRDILGLDPLDMNVRVACDAAVL